MKPAPPNARPPVKPFQFKDRGDLIPLVVIMAAALLLRLAFFFLNRANNPAVDFPIMDSLYHHQWATDIISGKFWGEEVYFKGPLYPYFLALLYKLGGSSQAFATFCQHLMGSLSCGLTYLLAREYFSKNVSLLAGIAVALYWPLVFFEGELLAVTLFVFLSLLFLVLLARAVRTGSSAMLLASAALFGLSAVTRPLMLALVPAVLLVLYLLPPRRPKGQAQWIHTWIGRSVIFGLGLVLVILPVTIRNYAVGGALVPVASSGGVNFYIGNNPGSDGRTAIVPGTQAPWLGGNKEAIAIAERQAGRKMTPSEVSSHYFKQGLNYIQSQPGAAAGLFMKKVKMFWSGPERSNDKFIYFFWHLAGFKYVPLPGFWLIAPLALLGAGLLWPRRRELSPLYLFILMYSLVVSVFFVNARFRLPVAPVLIPFAAYAAHYLFAGIKSRRKNIAAAALALLALIIIVNLEYPSFYRDRAKHHTISYYTLGSACLQQNQSEKAIAHYNQALRSYAAVPDPAYSLVATDVQYKLGALYSEAGDCQNTVKLLGKVTGKDQQSLAVRSLAADCRLKLGQTTQAFQMYRDLLRDRPGFPPALVGVARIYTRAGRLDEAAAIVEPMVQPGQLHAPALEVMADICIQREQYEQALSYLNQARRYAAPGDSTIQRKIGFVRRRL